MSACLKCFWHFPLTIVLECSLFDFDSSYFTPRDLIGLLSESLYHAVTQVVWNTKKSKPKQMVEADPPLPPVDQAPSPALSLHTVADDDIDMSDLSQVPPMLDPDSSSPLDWAMKVPKVICVFNQPGGTISGDNLLFCFARRLAKNYGTKLDKMDVIVQRKLVASPNDEWELNKLIT
ncbi:hypothetical protein B0F90DRAFT_1827323 [Multifurca ochricompacta]|uniref:Uncharacterized protein n=1 Tax=Multifurca ochricompacta TaxID=376703 RepID=A0AAD4LVA1_9AGAM|nr:hypothetical protein B0F90DRAFT_1827323 [Multifurca ochricompacta]